MAEETDLCDVGGEEGGGVVSVRMLRKGTDLGHFRGQLASPVYVIAAVVTFLELQMVALVIS